MTITKSEAFQQATTLGCCSKSGDQISTDCGSSMEDLEDSVALNEIPVNNNGAEQQEKYSFPKRESVDIEFKDLRYTPKYFNLSKLKFGK